MSRPPVSRADYQWALDKSYVADIDWGHITPGQLEALKRTKQPTGLWRIRIREATQRISQAHKETGR